MDYKFKRNLIFSSVALLFLFNVDHSIAFYGPSTSVIELTTSNFDSRVIDSDDVWIVEFFAPWCGHCKNIVQEYKKTALALKGVVKVGAVDADANGQLLSRFGVQGFPTIKIFGKNKKSPYDYNGPRTADGFIDAGFKELRNVVNSRISSKSSSSKSSSSPSNDVIELTDSNFKQKVLNSEDIWLVEFYAPWCGHCKNLAPIWAKAATELKGKVKLGALDATVHKEMAGQYNIRGFPTIKVFNGGKKDSSAEDYQGGRTVGDIVSFALEKHSEYTLASMPAPEAKQLVKPEQLEETCKNVQLCVISVLPHILDCQSKCRNDYLETLKKVAEKYKKNGWQYLWMEAGAQMEVENALEIGGFGYPAMAVINPRKMKYSILRGSFSFDGINEFLRDLMYGRGSSVAIRSGKLPTVLKTEPWDGKDQELPVLEYIDLNDENSGSKTEL